MRAFIAVDLPDDVQEVLSSVQQVLASRISVGVRWSPPGSTHITLKFLGEIDRGLTPVLGDRLQAAIQESRPFDIGTGSLGVFPNNRAPRVIWVGLIVGLDELATLQSRVEEELETIRIPREKRPFSPHLTIGRVKEGVSKEYISQIGQLVATTPVPAKRFTVHSINLMESVLTPRGAQYSTISAHRFPAST